MRTALLCLAASFPVFAADLDFKEQFVDPASRTASLARLVPGTRDWYFYRALDHQLNGRDKEFREAMTEWKTASNQEDNPVPSDGLGGLENRELLLSYQKDPDHSSEELIQRLNLHFDETRPDAQADEKIPDRITPEALSVEAFEAAAAKQYEGKAWRGYEKTRLFQELDKAASLSKEQRDYMLNKLTRADHPAVVGLIAAYHAATPEIPIQFGKLEIEKFLTVAQKAELLKQVPRLATNAPFILSYLAQLQPGDQTPLTYDRQAQADYAARIMEVTRPLPPALNAIKLQALYHHLNFQRELGNYPLEDFLAYLAFPRKDHDFVLPDAKDGLTTEALAGGDFSKATGLPAIGRDTPLLLAYLDHFLANAETSTPFAPFIHEKTLTRFHAEARLRAGADPARWGPALDPADFRNLQEETTIAFAPGQPLLLGVNDPVKLAIDLKNTPELLVRVYPIDLAGYLANHGKEPDVMLDLDGLVPHREMKLTYSQPSLVRHRETLDFPELTGRGVWVVETVSRGVAARALIRKGQLIPYVEPIAGAVTVRLFDEAGAPVPDAVVTIGSQRFTAEKGVVRIPGNIREVRRQSLVTGGGLATLAELKLGPAVPNLKAHFHLDREQVIGNEKANLRLGIRLTDHGAEMPLNQLTGLTLTLRSKQGDGQTSERVISDGVKPVADQTVEFLVPPDVRDLKFTLSAKVAPSTGGDPVAVSSEYTYEYGESLDLNAIGTILFSTTTEGHRLDLRGRNGEPLASRILTLEAHRDDYEKPVKLQIRTDQNGRVALGTLADISQITASGSNIPDAWYSLSDLHGSFWPSPIVCSTDEVLRLPLDPPATVLDRSRFGLSELIGGAPVRDRFDHLSIENGRLVVKGLPPGSYEIRDHSTTTITVSAGREQDGLFVTNHGILAKRVQPTPDIKKTELRDGSLMIQLDGFTPDTLVDLSGSRYRYDWNFYEPFEPEDRPAATSAPFPCSYLTERLLDGEMRYILDRRSIKNYPGSLLPRPGQLINRWSNSDASQSDQLGASAFAGNKPASPAVGRGLEAAKKQSDNTPNYPTSEASSIDFLTAPSVLRYALKPDAHGMVTVPLKDFATCQSIAVSVMDRHGLAAYDVVPLPPSDPALRDLRLNRPLDPQKHHVGIRGNTALAKDATITIDNALDANWRAFTTLTDAWAYLAGASYNAGAVRDFSFLTKWPALPELAKLDYLSDHACHELHLFLYRKDRAFFDKFVKPQLVEKKEPKFIDDFLLERDLSSYLRPYAWKRLNAAEKALLSRALPAANARVLQDLRQRWEKEAPTAEADNQLFAATLGGQGLSLEDSLGLTSTDSSPAANAATAAILSKLRSIIIPEINFEDTTVEEALDFLRLRSVELDPEADYQLKGVAFLVRRPSLDRNTEPGQSPLAGNPDALKIKELRLRNVPLSVALKYICDATRLRYEVSQHGISIVPIMESGENVFTRTFLVPPDFSAALDSSDGGDAGAIDPFASGDTSKVASPKRTRGIVEVLKSAGVAFGDKSSATLAADGKLTVTNTPTELDKIEALTSTFLAKSPPESEATRIESPAAFADSATIRRRAGDDESVDPFASGGDVGSAAKLRPRRQISRLDPSQTKIWRESNYYRKDPETTDATLIRLNRFWLDLAAWDGKGPFLSPNFNACIGSSHDALMALALLDLPFEAGKPEVTAEGPKLTVKARAPMVLFFKDTRETAKVAADSPVLLRQAIYRLDDPSREEDGRKMENHITGDLIAGVPYGLSLVISNPTGNERRVEVLAQIPAGAIALSGVPVTLSKTINLAPYGVENLAMAFYFPEAGAFPLYPLHVSEGDTVLAHTAAKKLQVTSKAPAENITTWPIVARDGTNEAVLERLRRENLYGLDLRSIRWRLQDKAFFSAVVSILRERLFFSPEVSSYGFHHRDVASIREYLENSGAVIQLGDWLDSPVLAIRPTEHLGYELLEFDPLVNPRAHRLGDQARITHPDAASRYEEVLDHLAWKPTLSDQDQMVLTLWLQLQDRTEQALTRFAQIDPTKLGSGRMAYDYLNAVLLFAQEKPAEAKEIALKYADHPLALWNDRFAAVVAQADEVARLSTNRPSGISTIADTAPSLEISAAPDGSLLLRHRNLKRTSLQLFHVDLEVLFSKDPFLSGDGASLPAIRANDTREVTLTEAGNETKVELPEAFRQGNVLVAADTGTRRVLQVIDSRAIEILRSPVEKIVQALDTTGKPLPKTYVKVYIESRDGTVKFHKDGYADLRGKFDYLTHTGETPPDIKRIAVLFIHPAAGAKTLVFEP